jgi:cytochrome c oxidase subunit III
MVLAAGGDAGIVSTPGLVATGLGDEVLPAAASGRRSFGWWGMVWLIATEATLFGILVASWFYVRATSGPAWPPEGIAPPELGLPLFMTAVLWSSSLPVHVADRGIRRGSQRRLRIGLALGFVLGAAFLGLQLALEWPKTLRQFTPQTNAYGSMFFTITGFHALHVAIGLLLLAWTQARAWQGAFDGYRHVTVQNVALYWHFVDAVWALVLVSLYLSPRVL